MNSEQFKQRWLKYLGGKPEHAGLGIGTIGVLLGFLGAGIAFLAPEPRGESLVYWAGFALGVIAVAICFVGLTYHFVLMAKGSRANNDA